VRLLVGLYDLGRILWWLGHAQAQVHIQRYRRWADEYYEHTR